MGKIIFFLSYDQSPPWVKHPITVIQILLGCRLQFLLAFFLGRFRNWGTKKGSPCFFCNSCWADCVLSTNNFYFQKPLKFFKLLFFGFSSSELGKMLMLEYLGYTYSFKFGQWNFQYSGPYRFSLLIFFKFSAFSWLFPNLWHFGDNF